MVTSAPPATGLLSRTRDPWAVVLAGGDGTRLAPLVRRIYDDGRPKQFAAIVGNRSMLADTLDRVGLLIPPERTVIVGNRSHKPLLSPELSGFPSATVLLQPRNRGTAPGVLLPISWIARRKPDAIVAVFPSDHFILGKHAFVAHISQSCAFVSAHPDRILLVGAPPTRPEPDLGWVEPGEPVGATASGPICRVGRFREKPAPPEARIYFESGYLWNTFVIVGRPLTFLAAAREVAPELSETVERAALAADDDRIESIDEHYAALPTTDFSRAILERSADRLVISRLPDRIWNDWGTPERVFESLADARLPVPESLRVAPTVPAALDRASSATEIRL